MKRSTEIHLSLAVHPYIEGLREEHAGRVTFVTRHLGDAAIQPISGDDLRAEVRRAVHAAAE